MSEPEVSTDRLDYLKEEVEILLRDDPSGRGYLGLQVRDLIDELTESAATVKALREERGGIARTT